MNENLIKLSEEKKADLIKNLASIAVQNLFTSTKSASDNDAGSFKFIISTADVDRQGESVDQAGWDLSFYKSNPIVLWGHDYSSLPIGVTTSIEVKDGKLIAEGKFAPADANPFAQQVRKLYDLGMVRATSVGFIPKEFDQKKAGVITKAELLEYSIVPVPANPYAITMNQVRQLNLDIGFLKTKGLEFTMTEEKAEEIKGGVEDEMTAVKTREEKWKNYMRVCEVVDAFCAAYFDESTPVENFKTLVSETAEILKGISGDEQAEKAVPESIQKLLGGRKSIRDSVEKSINVLKEAVENITKNFALGSITRAEGKEVSDNEANGTVVDQSKGTIELDKFLENRMLLRAMDKSLESVLRNFNETARKHK